MKVYSSLPLGQLHGRASKLETPQIKVVEAWRKKPQDEKRLQEALTAALLAKIEANETEGRKKRKASDSSDAGSSDNAEAKDESSAEAVGSGSEEASDDSRMEEGEDAEVGCHIVARPVRLRERGTPVQERQEEGEGGQEGEDGEEEGIGQEGEGEGRSR